MSVKHFTMRHRTVAFTDWRTAASEMSNALLLRSRHLGKELTARGALMCLTSLLCMITLARSQDSAPLQLCNRSCGQFAIDGRSAGCFFGKIEDFNVLFWDQQACRDGCNPDGVLPFLFQPSIFGVPNNDTAQLLVLKFIRDVRENHAQIVSSTCAQFVPPPRPPLSTFIMLGPPDNMSATSSSEGSAVQCSALALPTRAREFCDHLVAKSNWQILITTLNRPEKKSEWINSETREMYVVSTPDATTPIASNCRMLRILRGLDSEKDIFEATLCRSDSDWKISALKELAH
jgi:hypothetical protein